MRRVTSNNAAATSAASGTGAPATNATSMIADANIPLCNSGR
jgi:hypothetical protein